MCILIGRYYMCRPISLVGIKSSSTNSYACLFLIFLISFSFFSILFSNLNLSIQWVTWWNGRVGLATTAIGGITTKSAAEKAEKHTETGTRTDTREPTGRDRSRHETASGDGVVEAGRKRETTKQAIAPADTTDTPRRHFHMARATSSRRTGPCLSRCWPTTWRPRRSWP